MRIEVKRDPWSIQATWNPFTFASIAPGPGIAFYRCVGDGLILKAPWCEALFSERNGYRLPLFSLFGFRIFPLKAQELVREEGKCSFPVV
jgi:hypothetical protein